MKFAVGYQVRTPEGTPFTEIVEQYKASISEVFFPWQDFASGRSSVATRHGYTDWTAQRQQEEDLVTLRKMGMKLDLVLNGNCYGQYAMSEKLANQVCSIIDHLETVCDGVDIVTTASPAIAHTIRQNYPKIELRASVNMRIGTVKGMEYMAEYFDSFHIQRDYNRDLNRIKELKSWADKNGKKLIMLANSGCFSFCSGQTFHDNLVSHESEVCEVENLKDFTPYACWRMLKERKNWHYFMENTWVRPEDLHYYEGLFDTVKLATRMHDRPDIVISAYANRKFYGNLADLFEPGFGRAFKPYIVENRNIPEEWFQKVLSCNKQCHECHYCEKIFEQSLVNTDDYFFF